MYNIITNVLSYHDIHLFLSSPPLSAMIVPILCLSRLVINSYRIINSLSFEREVKGHLVPSHFYLPFSLKTKPTKQQ